MGQRGYTLMTWLSLPILICTVQNDWKPMKLKHDFTSVPPLLHAPIQSRKMSPLLGSCSLYKAVMDQHTFHQYIQYKHHIPELKEFTLCAWHKLYNHSTDHPIFSYSLPHKPRTILSWVANTPKKSYYMLAINGHTIYRINYPVKLFKWYHMCQSWNGKTGEWQLWVNNERVARGYYNLMVGKSIKSGGIAITGQNQIGREEGNLFKKKKVGLQGEITLLQLYKAALSKGKAYSDHRHHHAHKFNHDGEEEESTEVYPTIPPEVPTSEHPFLENGQLKPRLPVHELLAKDPTKSTFGAQSVSAFDHYHPTLFFKMEEPSNDDDLDHNFFFRADKKSINHSPGLKRLKREKSNETDSSSTETPAQKKSSEESLEESESRHMSDSMYERLLEKKHEKSNDNKRMLLIGDQPPPILDTIPNTGFFTFYSGLDGNMLHEVPSNFYKNEDFEENLPAKLEYEAAEWEVRKIAEVCSACEEDPFQKANVLSWQETPKKLFAGAEYIAAVPKCHMF